MWVKVSLKISYEDTIFLGNYEAERGNFLGDVKYQSLDLRWFTIKEINSFGANNTQTKMSMIRQIDSKQVEILAW